MMLAIGLKFIGSPVDILYQLFELTMIRDGVWYLRSNNKLVRHLKT